MSARRANGAGSITTRDDGALIVRASIPGSTERVKRIVARCRTADGRSESVRDHRRRAEAVLSELLGVAAQPAEQRERITVAQYFEQRYLPSVITAGRKASTIDGYRTVFAKYVRPSVGEIQLGALTVHDVDAMDVSLIAAGLSATTRGHARANLDRILRHAVKKDALARNPVERANALPRRDTERPDVLEDDEVLALLSASTTFEAGRWEAMVALATLGMRRGEILGLRRQDVDVPAATVTIRRNLVPLSGGRVAYEAPKSDDSERVLTLPRKTAALLAAAMIAAPPTVDVNGEDVDLVFADEAGRLIAPHRLTAAVKRLTERVIGRTLGPHQLRHWCASALINRGVDPVSVAAQLGHANANVTLAVYAKAFRRAQEETGATLAAVVGEW